MQSAELKHPMKRKILLFVSYYLPGFKSGGPLRTVKNMTDQLSDEFDFFIVTSDRDLGDSMPYKDIEPQKWIASENCHIYYLPQKEASFNNLYKIIISTPHDILYLNSFFSFIFSIKPIIITRFSKYSNKILLAPRGEFSQGALNLKRTKKSLYLKIARLLNLYNSVSFHASSEFECKDIVKAGFMNNIHIAIDLPQLHQKKNNSHELIYSDKLRVVFISRISPKKNLIFALKILKSVKASVVFDIFGPIEDMDYWDDCRKIIKNLPNNIECNYKGILKPSEVYEKFSEYDLFLFPTFGENYGHVIAESLSSGTSVLISDQTPWRNLSTQKLGWDIPLKNKGEYIDVIENLSRVNYTDRHKKRSMIIEKTHEKLNDNNIIEKSRKLFRDYM